jgi:tetratricopeptide (TPR) repeat protein
MKATVFFATFLALAPITAFAARVTFTRVIPPPHDLGMARRAAVIYAIGDSEKITTFVERFIDYGGRATLRIDNAVENNQHLSALNDATLRSIRLEHPADVYIGVNAFSCSGTQSSGEGSERDAYGERVRRLHMWVDAACDARLDVYGSNGRRLFTFRVHGEGTSPRAVSLSEEERDVAYEQAARYAALDAADAITPRIVRESIELDDTAPAFDQGAALINANRLTEAQKLWQSTLRRERQSAALNFNLSAVCEALGDMKSAEEYLRAAVRLSPTEARYRFGLDSFLQRNATQTK